MRLSYSKGFNIAGLLLLTLQLMILVFEDFVSAPEFTDVLVNNWAGILGYTMLMVLFFIFAKHGVDFILTIIGCMMWVAQFFMIGERFPDEPVMPFIFCGAGIMGVIFVLISLAFDMKQKRMNNKNNKVQ